MRALVLVLVLAACGGDDRTSGPIESTVSRAGDRIRVRAVRHALSLAQLDLSRQVGLPVTGIVEVDAALDVPAADFRRARGRLAVRCTDACRVGDDVARLHPSLGARRPASDAFAAEGVSFSHLDFPALEAEVTVADGH